HCVGDVKQSIYKFRKVNPVNFLNYSIRQKLLTLKLTNNYRSCQAIVDVCNAFGTSGQSIIGLQKQKINQPIVLWEYDEKSFNQLPLKFEQLIRDNNLNISCSAILARGKTTFDSLKSQSKNSKYNKSELIAMALDTWANSPKNTENLTLSLKFMGQAICYLAYDGHGDYKNQHCPLNSDAVSWRLLLRALLNDGVKICPFKVDGNDVLWPKWVLSLKSYLESSWQQLPQPQNQFADIKGKIRAPDNSKTLPVRGISDLVTVQNNIRTTTIHSVKGESLEAVLLLSHPNKQSKGGHYSHWIAENVSEGEHIRFAYVACSRPMHSLVLATPKLNKKERADLQKIGFISDSNN
ncbi:MAG TPA: hypothetical protein DCO83_10775, partial [Mucilaginibacter sp.]|nr:hypothetical protein [Mucilaginibacter sp.]